MVQRLLILVLLTIPSFAWSDVFTLPCSQLLVGPDPVYKRYVRHDRSEDEKTHYTVYESDGVEFRVAYRTRGNNLAESTVAVEWVFKGREYVHSKTALIVDGNHFIPNTRHGGKAGTETISTHISVQQFVHLFRNVNDFRWRVGKEGHEGDLSGQELYGLREAACRLSTLM